MSISGNVYNNLITINDGYITGGVTGGVAFFPYNSDAKSGDVFGNTIIVNGGTIGFVSGGEIAYTYDTSTGSTLDFSSERFQNAGNVYGNTVIINGGTILNGVSGGSALTGSSLDNLLNIYSGKVSGYVIGGEVRNPSTDSSITGNTINIGNINNPSVAPDLTDAYIVGGLSGSSYISDGNTLNIYASNITARNIAGFDSVNFFVSNDTLQNPTNPILTLTGGRTNLNLDSIGVQMPGNSDFNTGATVNLLYNSRGITSSNSSLDTTITKGVTSIYELNLANNSTGITATVGNRIGDTQNVPNIPRAAPVTLNIVEPFISMPENNSVGNVGNYMTDEDGYFLESEDSKAQMAERVHEQRGFELFLNTGAGRMKTKTGDDTYIRANSTNYDLGLGKTLNTGGGNLYIAPLIEYNHGNYEAKLKNNTNGRGNTKYTAGGFIFRNMNNSGFYYEASFRGGRAENEFTADNFLVNSEPQRVSYRMSAPLFAGHLRLGNFSRIDRNNVLELYGIFAYSHQNGMDSDLSSGEHVRFGAVHSHLERLGYRLTTRISKVSRIYTGLAFQYEGNSTSTASGDDWSSSSAGAKGASGMLELGWQFKPASSLPWMVDTYATGWLGHQSGFTAMAKFKKAF